MKWFVYVVSRAYTECYLEQTALMIKLPYSFSVQVQLKPCSYAQFVAHVYFSHENGAFRKYTRVQICYPCANWLHQMRSKNIAHGVEICKNDRLWLWQPVHR